MLDVKGVLHIGRVREVLGGSLPAGVDPPGPFAAAVATILRQAPAGLEVLFIKRAERDGDPWSGHMAFPGGRREPHDSDLYSTALRETVEEIGVDLSKHAELVGVLEDQDATGRRTREPLPTRPYVFELRGAPDIVLSAEVTEVVWAPVEPLRSGHKKTSIDIDWKGDKYTLPAWDVDGRVVWGLTYRMLSTLFGRFP